MCENTKNEWHQVTNSSKLCVPAAYMSALGCDGIRTCFYLYSIKFYLSNLKNYGLNYRRVLLQTQYSSEHANFRRNGSIQISLSKPTNSSVTN